MPVFFIPHVMSVFSIPQASLRQQRPVNVPSFRKVIQSVNPRLSAAARRSKPFWSVPAPARRTRKVSNDAPQHVCARVVRNLSGPSPHPHVESGPHTRTSSLFSQVFFGPMRKSDAREFHVHQSLRQLVTQTWGILFRRFVIISRLNHDEN